MIGDFTPFGYLRNPGHRAASWADTVGGNLRSATDRVGLEWVYPAGRDARQRVGMGIETTVDGRLCRSRGDFDAIGLTSRYHSCLILGFDWLVDGVRVEARYFLHGHDALCLRLSVANHASEPRAVLIGIAGWVDADVVEPPGSDLPWVLTHEPSAHVIVGSVGEVGFDTAIEPGAERQAIVVLGRGPHADAALATGIAAAASADQTYARLLAEDAEFSARCPTLRGDWPAHWREGLVYDFETTRLLVQPAGGIFTDVWPSWMAAWPRVVLAEGVLDMLRLAYADPVLAQRAVLSLFRDAPQPNVPCVFQGGEFNMVAADGSRCGTSPAWCLPFLHLQLLYLRTLDRQWLGQLYPFAAALLGWWLEHRTDAEGWVVYKCTWESGEDGNPRLDATESGDADISRRVRPVELQATVAHAASVLAFFADELGLPSEAARWRRAEVSYRERTRRLFDPATDRFRDWLVAERRFQEPRPDRPYWGIDSCRYAVQSLTPLLLGESLDEAEVWRHARPPWTLWPSWTLSLVESAAAAGLGAGIGRLAFETIDRVYRVTTRREMGSLARPLPGCAPEFWPQDWRTYAGNDAYGWGATTANLLIRHLFGFKESRQTDGWVAELAPALPDALLADGRRLGIRHLNYRGLVFDLTYVLVSDRLEATLDLGSGARRCSVRRADDMVELAYSTREAASVHRFQLEPGLAYTLRLA